MKFWTIEDLRNPKRASGFDRVGVVNPHRRKQHYQARLGPRAEDWIGRLRETPEEAAQDYCDYMNGRPVPPAAPREPDLAPRGRARKESKATRNEGFPATMRRAIYARAEGQCENCDAEFPYLEAHHIEEGVHDITLAAALCPNCHVLTYRGTPEEADAVNNKLREIRAAEKEVLVST